MIKLYKIGRWFYKKDLFLFSVIIRNLIYFISNSYVPPSAKIGEGTIFAYGGIGMVIHANAIIGENCVLGQGITIGAAEGFVAPTINACPRIGSNCYIGAGAKILGDITVGNNCQIGAGAIVLHDIPDNSVVVGVPAKIIKNTTSSFRAIVR